MKYKIHRGSNEIGGTCIEVSTDRTTILLDLGLPLSKRTPDPDLKAIRPDAVLISHPHLDHYGLIDRVSNRVPVFIGEVGRDLIDATRMFLRRAPYRNEFCYLGAWKPFQIGDLRITPYLVDHSACDAYAFLVEGEGRRIFYSGDFRAHGRKSVLFRELVRKPPKDIDVLFMEGTMLGRDNSEFPTEEAVEAKILDILRSQDNISFLISSSQNIDRVVSAYKACRKARKTLVLDLYTAWVLEKVRKKANGVPGIGWPNIRITDDKGQKLTLLKNQDYFGGFAGKAYRHLITEKELLASPEQFLVLFKMSRFKMIRRFMNDGPVNVIYSQWQGYLKCTNDEYFGAEETSTLIDDPMVHWAYAHTSGHATVEDLKVFANALNPKILVPVHTEMDSKFEKYFSKVNINTDRKLMRAHKCRRGSE